MKDFRRMDNYKNGPDILIVKADEGTTEVYLVA